MIALIDGEYFEMVPIPAPEGKFNVKPKDDRFFLYKGDKRIDFGPKWYLQAISGHIDTKTGKFTPESPGNHRIRVIFDGKHLDIEATVG